MSDAERASDERSYRTSAIVRRRVLAAALLLFSGPTLVGSDPLPLPDSVMRCLPCHHRAGSDQVGEWLTSPYSEAKGGRGCTDCHVARCSGCDEGPKRDTDTATPRPWPSNAAARLTVTATCDRSEITAEVAISNVGVGHLLPTGSAERTLLLEITVEGQRSVVVQPRLLPFATRVGRHRFALGREKLVRVSARLLLSKKSGIPSELTKGATVCVAGDATRDRATHREGVE